MVVQPAAPYSRLIGLICLGWLLAATLACGGRGVSPDRTASAMAGPSAAPCDDFYTFVNGDWLAANAVPDDRSSWSSYSEVAQRTHSDLLAILGELADSYPGADPDSNEFKLGVFFDSCMDTETIESAGQQPVARELDQIAAIQDRDDLLSAMAHLQRIGIDAPFSLGAIHDPRDSSRMLAEVWQNPSVLPGRHYYIDEDDEASRLREEYVEIIVRGFELIGHELASARRQAQAVLQLESDLTAASMTRLQMRDPHAVDNFTTLDDLDAAMPHIDWRRFLTEARFPSTVELNVGQPDYLQAVDRLLADRPLEHWKSYLTWWLVERAAAFLSSDFQALDFSLSQLVSGVTKQRPREERCVGRATFALGQALGRTYGQRKMPSAAMTRAHEMIGHLRAVFLERIEELDWMSESTRADALAKIETLKVRIGYPDELIDYGPLEVRSGPLLDNMLAASVFHTEYNWSKLGRPAGSTEWRTLPQSVSGSYSVSENTLTYPAAKFQPPFFDATGDEAANYGAIGATIAHEFTHALDDEGRKYDAKGNLRDWWTAEDAARFQELTHELVEQFSGYRAVDSVLVDGELTLGENIADLGGVTLAYEAFRRASRDRPVEPSIDGLTPEQRFFVSWAGNWRVNRRPESARSRVKTNVHAPGHWRANGPLSNLAEFATAFDCRPGDAMLRPAEQRVRIW